MEKEKRRRKKKKEFPEKSKNYCLFQELELPKYRFPSLSLITKKRGKESFQSEQRIVLFTSLVQ